MKVIAKRSFRNVQNKLDGLPLHVAKGTVFTIGDTAETPFEKLPAEMKQLVALLNFSGALGDANDPKVVAAIKAEVAAEAKLAARDAGVRPFTGSAIPLPA
jgi:hypothetical protein